MVLVLCFGASSVRAQTGTAALPETEDPDSVAAPPPGVAPADDGSAETVEAFPEPDPDADPTLEIFRDEDTHWWLSVNYFVAAQLEDDAIEDALDARGYGDGSITFGGEASGIYRVQKWLGLGARLGIRHQHWNHYSETPASALGIDLQFVVTARWVAKFGDIGVDLSGGVGLIGLRLNEVTDYQVAGRLQAGPVVAINLFGSVRALVRFGYDLNRRDFGGFELAMGGGFFALGLEVRE